MAETCCGTKVGLLIAKLRLRRVAIGSVWRLTRRLVRVAGGRERRRTMCLPANINENISTNIQNYNTCIKTKLKEKKNRKTVWLPLCSQVTATPSTNTSSLSSSKRLLSRASLTFVFNFQFKVTIMCVQLCCDNQSSPPWEERLQRLRKQKTKVASVVAPHTHHHLEKLFIQNITRLINKAGTKHFIVGFQSFFCGGF